MMHDEVVLLSCVYYDVVSHVMLLLCMCVVLLYISYV